MTAQPVITRLGDLYDVDVEPVADGDALVRAGSVWQSTPIASAVALSAETTARQAADTAEATARASGDTTTLASAKTYADAGDAAEATARTTAVSGEATARTTGDTATLASAKTYADTGDAAEAAARATAVTAAQTTAIGAAAGLALVLGG